MTRILVVEDDSDISMLAVQRKAKDWSRFRRLVGVQGEARFAPALEHARTAVLEALTQLPPAHRELAELVPRVFEELHS